MQLLARPVLLAGLLLASVGAAQLAQLAHLAYELPAELLALATGSGGTTASTTTAAAAAAATSNTAAACFYPANFTLDQFTTWTPAANTSQSYVSFVFRDDGTRIRTPCVYNATSPSLTAGTSLAARYACGDPVVAFIWQKNEATLIEATCPGQTATHFEAAGSVRPGTFACTATDAAWSTELGAGPGLLCTATAPMTANFTSQEPSPLQK
ncbi:hypothetical protein SPI_03101 [Niveomyces insectorum RCEF 264]|uniref:AA1-like domain-containing protein n=1 Tax=Niveomyces insectorum RCEF 264 TaxID=1081102 RepID=A0A167X2I9_9HYPO|nr:hypothetical protein SPI_03101 [Niveomyces insectorum RCEF 264]